MGVGNGTVINSKKNSGFRHSFCKSSQRCSRNRNN